MKTTLDIPVELLNDVQKYSSHNTRKDAVITALSEYVERKKMAELVQLKGSMKTLISQQELTELRKGI